MKTSIDNLTIGQAKELAEMFGSEKRPRGLSRMVGEKCIVRTYNAGVWFGTVVEKSGNEVIVEDARRMWRWRAEKSISLSGVAIYGIRQDHSRIAPAVESVWLEAIELIPVTSTSATLIEDAPDAEAQ